MPPFLHRLDFYGGAIELLGLAILLSYDVPFLQPQLMRLPWLRRRREALHRLRRADDAIGSEVMSYEPLQVLTLEGEDAARFLALYPDWEPRRAAPGSLVLYLIHGNRLHSIEPWIFPSGDDGIPVATALFLSTLFAQEEREIQKSVYTLGFLTMLLGGMLSLIQIMRG